MGCLSVGGVSVCVEIVSLCLLGMFSLPPHVYEESKGIASLTRFCKLDQLRNSFCIATEIKKKGETETTYLYLICLGSECMSVTRV